MARQPNSEENIAEPEVADLGVVEPPLTMPIDTQTDGSRQDVSKTKNSRNQSKYITS